MIIQSEGETLVEAIQTTNDVKVKTRRWKKACLISAIIVLVLVIGTIIFVNVYINRGLPQVSGEIKLEGLKEPVTVTRDESGVPHISAANAHDLFMAQGYVQAQDRLLQMELARRQASGTLSEVVGEAAIEQDKYFRTLGLRRAAEASLPLYSDEAVRSLEAFAQGVNMYIDKVVEENRLPPEFKLMGIEPGTWQPVDSLTIGKYMAFDLGGHWERQAFNYYALAKFPEEKALELFPSYPKEAPTIINESEVVDVATSFQDAVIPPEFNGSNNWVLSGERTESGLPLLADDPHLGLATPSIWYQMHLDSPGYQVSGVIFAGIPGIILGHNEDIAWGVTNVGPDVQQLYIEKRNPNRPDEFQFEGNWEQAEVIPEPIKVKGEETIDYEVVETRHGPVISEFAEQSGKDKVLSLRWTALDPTTELEAVLEINRASNWQEFEKGLEKFLAPAQNFVFASKGGTIAYKANGRIPIYETEDDALLPLRGWEEEDEWNGYIPFNELPTLVNPEKGYIATANNKVVSESYPYHISHNWAQPYRYKRIAEMIEGKQTHSVENMKDMQLDVRNLQAEEFLPFMLAHVEEGYGEVEKAAVNLMEKWTYEDDYQLPQPLIFHTWNTNIQAILYNESIPKEMRDLFHGAGQTTDEMVRSVINGEESIWVEEAGGIKHVLNESFSKTITELTEQYGNTPSDWRWGDGHAVEFTHPLSSIRILGRFFNPGDPVPVSGSRVTVRAAGYNDNGLVNHGASWRYVTDLGEPTEAEHVVGPGQSGHFRSEWYHDQFNDWVEGGYHTTDMNDFTGEELRLTP
ncbi:penicillin acylase family protein [Halobacillus shinanisalinarum]|uniref:Penicillin acylase family protein n=1 Tax=Halobacillus shinanisalinarum TaxID=2932258 RepID=A0ABY4GY05_9BACI|nr:penicillin acylase family protein [Halobacillus shinanisalinarum]UOQ92959.1 penicillin acylase family protein [Halobacillus shinanisalinarum]